MKISLFWNKKEDWNSSFVWGTRGIRFHHKSNNYTENIHYESLAFMLGLNTKMKVRLGLRAWSRLLSLLLKIVKETYYMGYTIYFEGGFTFDKPLTAEHRDILIKFSEDRHDNLIERSYYCQWVPTADGKYLVWDEGEKFYAYVEWLECLIKNFIEPWGYVLNGAVTWEGDARDDVGMIEVVNNQVTERPGRIIYD